MKEYLFGCIILSLITAIAVEGVPDSLESSVRSAVGVGLIVFAAIPLGNMVSDIITKKAPDLTVPETDSNAFHDASKEAYTEGVAALLSSLYSCPAEDFTVSVDGFDEEDLSVQIMHVTLSGKAVYLDYRELSEYIVSNLKVVKCDVQIEFS